MRFFHTHESQHSLSPAAGGNIGGEHGPHCDLRIKDGRAGSALMNGVGNGVKLNR